MRAKLLDHDSQWLVGDYEPPKPFADKRHLTVRRVHYDTHNRLVGMKLLPSGTGVWSMSGKLARYFESGADLCWHPQTAELLSLEVQFGPCQQKKGVRHRLKRLDANSCTSLGEMEICVPTGGVEYLVLDHQAHTCLATWLDQTEWGYVVVDLGKMSQLSSGLFWPSPTLSPPGFSPDDRFVVSCNLFKSGWWTDEVDEYWEYASPGGLRKLGVISVHDLRSDRLSQHDVFVELPVDWIPDRPEEAEWDRIWGPEFVSERQFRIWLPDESTEVLTLPLPAQIVIYKSIGTVRNWLGEW